MVRRLAEDETIKKRGTFLNHPDKEVRKRREAWLKRIDEEANHPPSTIVEEEFEWAQEVVKKHKRFRCPFDRHPFGCDGHLCDLDVYDSCLEFLEALLMLHQIARGEIRVQWRTMKVRL